MITVGIFKGCLKEEVCRHHKVEREAILHTVLMFILCIILYDLEIGTIKIKFEKFWLYLYHLYLSLGV